MTTLYLVRHGETDWNAQNRWQGVNDVPLNDVGRAQAQALGRAFAGAQVDGIFCSDLSRARETAQAIAEATGAPVEVVAALRERSLGAWEGRTNDELAADVPEQMAAYRADPVGFAPPGGQAWSEFAPRAVEAVEALAQRYPDRRLVIVAHGGTLRAFLQHVLGVERSPLSRFQLDNASISVVRMREHKITGQRWWQVVALNITAHLNGALPV